MTYLKAIKNTFLYSIFWLNISLLYIDRVLAIEDPGDDAVINTGYRTMIKFPGVSDTDPSFADYINILFTFAIVAGALIAVIQVIIGGAMYMTSSANVSSKKAAITKIRSALVGLIIILLTWVILDTINPNLNVIQIIS